MQSRDQPLDQARRKSLAFVGSLCLSTLIFMAPAHSEHESISLSFNSDWPPYSHGIGAAVDGILPKLLQTIIEGEMGIPVKAYGSPWTRAQTQVRNGNLDALVTAVTKDRMTYTEASKSVVFNLQMRPIVKIGSDLHQRLDQSFSIDDLKSLRVCDILANGWAQRFFSDNDIDHFVANTASECLRLIRADRADVMIQPAEVAMALIREMGLEGDITPARAPLAEMNFKLLLSKHSNLPDNFMIRFDETMDRMRADGSLDQLVQKLSAMDH